MSSPCHAVHYCWNRVGKMGINMQFRFTQGIVFGFAEIKHNNPPLILWLLSIAEALCGGYG